MNFYGDDDDDDGDDDDDDDDAHHGGDDGGNADYVTEARRGQECCEGLPEAIAVRTSKLCGYWRRAAAPLVFIWLTIVASQEA